MDEEEFDPEARDTHFWAAETFGGGTYTQALDRERRLAFWREWLDLDVPSVLAPVEQLTQ